MNTQSIQKRLANGSLTSVDLVNQAIALARHYLDKNSIAAISPLALYQAKKADEERAKGFLRGPLHGIPILIKDNILYADGTPTTSNSYALKDFIPKKNAPLVDLLIEDGAIILGKANLSEFAYFMGDEKTPSGYGSMYGQVKHPVDEKIDPYGSSTGSAVAVALNVVPIAIGTETNGSLMAPAYQCQIVSFKPTPGMISRTGIIPISPTQDTAGPMAMSVYDCGVIMECLNVQDEEDEATQKVIRPASFLESMQQPLQKKRVGILSFSNQTYDGQEQKVMVENSTKLKHLGHDVIDISMMLPPLENYPTLLYEFRQSLNDFLHLHHHEGAPASLEAIIKINEANPERCLKYGQATLIQAATNQTDAISALIQQTKLIGEAGQLETLMVAHQLDVVMTPIWLGFAPIYGNPSLCIPAGYRDGQPKAVVLVGRKGHDVELLQFGYHAYDLNTKVK